MAGRLFLSIPPPYEGGGEEGVKHLAKGEVIPPIGILFLPLPPHRGGAKGEVRRGLANGSNEPVLRTRFSRREISGIVCLLKESVKQTYGFLLEGVSGVLFCFLRSSS
jgi:hypothetical protein